MYSFFFFFTFWPHPVGCRIRNLRSPTRDWAHTLCIGRQSLIHWTSREAPTFPLCSGVSWIFSALIVVDTWPRHLPWDGYRRASLKNVPDSHQPLLCAAFFFLALFLREIVIFLIILEVYVIQLYHDFPPMNKKKSGLTVYRGWWHILVYQKGCTKQFFLIILWRPPSTRHALSYCSTSFFLFFLIFIFIYLFGCAGSCCGLWTL